MSNTKLNCCKCGKEFEITERVYTCGTLWQCEECAIKQMQDNDERDKKISDLEAKLAEKEKENTKLKEVVDCVDKLKQFNADMNDYALVNKYVADEIYCECQDKISFAVEQLVGVRKDIDCYMAIREGDLTDSVEGVLIYFADRIEQLIKKLTHQHEDKGETK